MEHSQSLPGRDALLANDLNAQLDAKNKEIVLALAESRIAAISASQKPLLGDVVTWPNGETRRISAIGSFHLQTSRLRSGSYFAFQDGKASFSGSFMHPQLEEFFVRTDEVKGAAFWFFSHNVIAPNQGVDCALPCRVWRFAPFERCRKEAMLHPAAIHSANCWGAENLEHKRNVQAIMNPRVMADPEHF